MHGFEADPPSIFASIPLGGGMTDRQALLAARRAFRAGSKSFATAALLFDRRTRRDATLLYAWCRHCDDVIDGQVLGHGHAEPALPAGERLAMLERQTRAAFAGEPMHHAPFAGLQHAVRRHGIPLHLALDHLEGFRMDAEGHHYATITDTLDYCYHVAGVVGLMMAHIMQVRDHATLGRACDLGIALQLTNIARDLVEDAGRGRVYLPADWLLAEGIAPATIGDPAAAAALVRLSGRLLALAGTYYQSASLGIGALPRRSAWAVATARAVYEQIGFDIQTRGEAAWNTRVRTSRHRKAQLMLRSLWQVI